VVRVPARDFAVRETRAVRKPSFLHDLCKNAAKRAELAPARWHPHRFRDNAATRWLRGNRRQDSAGMARS
jgi:hypothetical protein